MKKVYLFAAALITMMCSTHTLLVAQNEKSAMITFANIEGGHSFGYMSPSGNYLCGGWDGGSGFMYDAVNKITYDFSEDGMGGMYVADVSDEGTVVGAYGAEYMTTPAAVWKDGHWTSLPQPEKYDQGVARAISADGTIVGGYVAIDGSSATTRPCIWRLKGNMYEYELLPYPEKDWNGDISNGVHILDMSTDGNILLGRIVDQTGSYNLPIIWTLGESGYTFKTFGEDILFNLEKEKPGPQPIFEEYVTLPEGAPGYDEQNAAYGKAFERYFQLLAEYTTGTTIECYWITLSGNGRYVSTALRKSDPNSDPINPWGVTLSTPCRFDLSNGTKITIDQYNDALAMYTTNDGLTLLASPQSGNIRTTHVLPVGSTTPILFHEWLKSNYNLDITPKLTFTYQIVDMNTGEMITINDSIITGSPMINPQGNIIAAGLMSPQDNSIINYQVHLSDGTSIKNADSSTINIYVRDNTLCWEGEVQNVAIVDLSGKQVCRNSISENSISIASLSAGVYLIKITTDTGKDEIRKIMIRK